MLLHIERCILRSALSQFCDRLLGFVSWATEREKPLKCIALATKISLLLMNLLACGQPNPYQSGPVFAFDMQLLCSYGEAT